MSNVVTSKTGGADFTPHEAGNFMGVCADAFIKEYPNKYKGQLQSFGKNKGKPDERETIEKVCISFLTTEQIDIKGEMKPRMCSFWAPSSLGSADYPSNLRKFIKGWFPTLKDDSFDRFDLDKLIGRNGWLTITQEKGNDGKTYANVVSATQPPPGVPSPTIPSDFVRHQDKPQAAPVTNDPAAKYNTKESIAAGHSEDITPAGPQQGVPAPEIDDLPW